jgi:hypothetical protein
MLRDAKRSIHMKNSFITKNVLLYRIGLIGHPSEEYGNDA